MKLDYIKIQNFKSVKNMEIEDIEQALILVGKNNTGKTVVLDAIRMLTGEYTVSEDDFDFSANIVVRARFLLDQEDLVQFNQAGVVSQYKRFDLWYKEFCQKLPCYQEGILEFEMVVNKNGGVRYADGHKKDNEYIRQVLPVVHYIDSNRNFKQIQQDIMLAMDDVWLSRLKSGKCIFDTTRTCVHCFSCIGMIEKKTPSELNVYEAARLFEYKLYSGNISHFETTVNEFFEKNGGAGHEIRYTMNFDPGEACKVNGNMINRERGRRFGLDQISTGTKSIYILSLLEAYITSDDSIPSMILMEDPEMFLHPQLQKVAGEILFRLSKKNQVIFSTYSPNMLFNFTMKQIRQVVLDEDFCSVVNKETNIDEILNDLGYTAKDLMNVNFVFIVEGRQDKNRLPLLLNRYYQEILDEEGKPIRIAIITTNSCTNIKTYANLKYMNQLYFQDNFLMIRDGDGKNHQELVQKLCSYYNKNDDVDRLPRVTSRNVLVLKYYSFENYFLNPEIMTQLGIVDSTEGFYDLLYDKWDSYLKNLASAKVMTEMTGIQIQSKDDLKNHMEELKIYLRGHNLFDIFYGKYRQNETEILEKYMEIAPSKDFADILESIDHFVYFENRKIHHRTRD